MYFSDKILGVICDLSTSSGIQLIGQFVKPGSNIWFAGRMKIEDLRSLDHGDTIDLAGTVNGLDIYIDEASISHSSKNGFDTEYVNVNILPYQICIGKKNNEINFIRSLSASIPELNNFFPTSFYPVFGEDSKDGCILKKDIRHLDPIIYSKNKQISVSTDLNILSKDSDLNIKSIYNVDILFDTEQSLKESLKDLSVFRLLLILISDSFVPLPPELIINAKVSEQFDDYSNITIWLNDNRLRYPVRENKPFLILYEDIKINIKKIWLSWFDFYDNPLNSPLIELIYQIIASQSLGLNRFLNICQAIEVYSTQYRNHECKALLKKYQKCKNINTKKITLAIRVADLFHLHNDIFPYNDIEIFELSSEIADLRNYYTHYNPIKQRKLQEKHKNIKSIYAKYDYSMYALLLATIYKEIDIPTTIIKNSLIYFDTRFGKTLGELFEGPDE